MATKATDRKYRIALLSLALCTLAFLATAYNDKLGTNYGTFVMAVGMVLGLYGGANVGNKWVLAKHGVLKGPNGEVEEEEEETIITEVKPKDGAP